MFAGRPEAAAAELARVVKPGGRIVLATWKNDSNVFNMFGVMKAFMPALPQPAPPSPFEWGKAARLEELPGANFDLSIEEGTNQFRYGSGDQAWQLWLNNYGPSLALAGNLDDARRDEFKRAMIAWHETFPSPLGYQQPRQYLVTRGHPQTAGRLRFRWSAGIVWESFAARSFNEHHMKAALVILIATALALRAPSPAHAQVDTGTSPAPPAPATSPALEPAVATPADEAACTPVCSPGYECTQGVCKTRCNPACQRGEYCNEMRLCALIPTPTPPPTPAVVGPPHLPDPAIEASWQATTLRRQRDLTRVQARKVPRLTLGLGFAISDLEKGDFAPSMMGLVLRAGWRKNLLGWMGVQIEGEASLGRLRGDNVQVTGSSLVDAWGASGAVFFNAGRCYMGPFGAVERRTYSADGVQVSNITYDLDRFGPWHGTVGAQVGLLLMGKDQIDLNLRTGGVQPEDGLIVMFSAGYHFLL